MYDIGNPCTGLEQAQKFVEYIEILNSITCGKHLHDPIISLRGEVWAHKTTLVCSLFIEVPVLSQESERSCICGFWLFLRFFYWTLELFFIL